MTWKERRNISIMLSVIAVLFIALLIVFGIRYRAHRQELLAGLGGGGTPVPTGAADMGVPADPGAYQSLTYYNGSVTLTFTLDGGGAWTWADGPDFPLNDETVASILKTLSELKFQQVIASAEPLETYGLDRPSATLTAASAGGSAQTLAFGKTTTNGDSYYLMMNGDADTVYIVADTIVKLMSVPIYDMCAMPELPDLGERNLKAITIQGPASEEEPSGARETADPETAAQEPPRPTVSLLARRASGEDQPALWFDGSDNVTASALCQDLLHDLETLAFSKCVDYYPSSEALEICGFDNPDAILKVEYASGGLDQTFTLEIGARMPDGSGRYARLGDRDALYALHTEGADALVSIAAYGMRGAPQDGGAES